MLFCQDAVVGGGGTVTMPYSFRRTAQHRRRVAVWTLRHDSLVHPEDETKMAGDGPAD
jgi:hypothetical protein